jgi:hypothetical protein
MNYSPLVGRRTFIETAGAPILPYGKQQNPCFSFHLLAGCFLIGSAVQVDVRFLRFFQERISIENNSQEQVGKK